MVERCFGRGGGFGRPRRALAALALSLLASGCYSYMEVSPVAVPPGSAVRLTVDRARLDSAGQLPLNGSSAVRGRLEAGSDPDTLRLSVALGDTEPGLASRGLRSTVSVPVADVMRAEVRRLDRGRTGVFVGGSAFVAYLVTRWAFDVLDPTKDPNDGGEGGVDNARVVMFRLRW